MKVISYNPKEMENIASFMNKYIDEYKDEKYIMFIFDDVLKEVKDKETLVHKYEELLTKMDLPYAFFPYYAHFNKILPNLIGKPSPRITVKMKDGFMFDVVQEPAFCMLVLDVEKLNKIGFKFNEAYKISFYIQDIINKCFSGGLYISRAYFLDVHNSYNLFNNDFKAGFMFNAKDFLEEKKKFYEENKDEGNEQINDFVKNLKNRYTVVEPEIINKEEQK